MNTTNTGFSFGQQSAIKPVATCASSSFSFGQSSGAAQPSSGGFSFGSTSQPGATATVNPLSSSGFSFGAGGASTGTGFAAAPQTTSTSGFSFGQANANINPGSSGLTLGQAAPASSSAGFTLGQAATTSFSGFSLGQTTPATTSTSGISFGLNPSTAGQTSATGAGLGQNPSATGAGFGLGQNPTSSGAGFSLGQNPTSSGAGFSLGQNPTSSGAGFGLGQNPTSSGAGFGLGQNPTSSGTGFGLGQNPTSSGAGFSLGQNPSSSTGNLSSGLFSQTPQSTTSTSSTGLFGQAPIAASIASSGGLFAQTPVAASVATSGGLFGQSPASTAPGLLSQPTGGLFGQSPSQQTQPVAGLNFGLSASSASGGLFNQPSSSLPSTTPNFGTSVASASVGLGGSLPTSATSSTGGLGGFQNSSIDSGVGSIGGGASKGDGKSAKEAPLPQDIFATIAVFEGHKDMEKKCSEDNIRQTAAPFHKLVEDTKKLRQHIVKLSNQHIKLHTSAQKLKSMVIQEAENVEMARRTQDTPMNLQGDNKAPEQFFIRLIRSFEERMTFCRNRIDEVEKCARSNGSVSEITSEDMKEVLKKEHEMVKMLAAKLYTLHNQLVNYSANPEMQPEALFKPHSNEHEPLGISIKNSSILRPALGEGGSGLLNFQNGQQRAKAVSLGAAPPTLPLMQTSLPNLLGSTNTSMLFTGSSNSALGSPFHSFNANSLNNNQTNFGGFGNKTGFSSNTPNSSSFFASPTQNANQNLSLFGSPASPNNSSFFTSSKNFKKSHESDDTQRKRRL